MTSLCFKIKTEKQIPATNKHYTKIRPKKISKFMYGFRQITNYTPKPSLLIKLNIFYIVWFGLVSIQFQIL